MSFSVRISGVTIGLSILNVDIQACSDINECTIVATGIPRASFPTYVDVPDNTYSIKLIASNINDGNENGDGNLCSPDELIIPLSNTPTPTPTSTPTPTPTATPTPTPTATPTATPTPTPTTSGPTPTPTPTGTPTPTPTLTPDCNFDVEVIVVTNTPTPTPTPTEENCLCYCVTYDPVDLPEDLYVRYALCGTASTETELISDLDILLNEDGTYTSCICVKQGGAYATPVCVQGGLEVVCPVGISWVMGSSCGTYLTCSP